LIFSPFSLTSAPFSWRRFGAFMAGLAVIAGFSLLSARAPERGRDAAQVTTGQAAPERGRDAAQIAAEQAATTEAQFGVVRFGAPAEEIRGQLRQLGLPWFLRKQGASGQFDWDGDSNATLRVIWRGQSVGRFVERLVAIDEDRSKLLVAFEPADPTLLRQLLAAVDTKYDPVSLMRVVMIEHARSSIEGESFDVSVLEKSPGFLTLVFRSARRVEPRTDDFPLSSRDQQAANLRRAYREEAKRAGIKASQL
jgi:hypothetical protein